MSIYGEGWQVVVIGGGPAGMIAAGRAAERGRSVLLLEKNRNLGNKLMLTGGGRCNLTNNKSDMRTMLKNYGEAEKYLYSTFSQFGVEDTLDFFESIGVNVIEEDGGRIFPDTNKAKTVLEALIKYMDINGVEIRKELNVSKFDWRDRLGLFEIGLENGQIIETEKCILATGGITYPETGSTGDGLGWLKSLGHSIVVNKPSLVPIKIIDNWPKDLTGLTLEDVTLVVRQNNKKKFSVRGSLLFTHFGVSGPMVLNMSKRVGELLGNGEVKLEIDLLPEVKFEALDQRMRVLVEKNTNKLLKNILSKIVSSSLVKPLLRLAGIDENVIVHNFRREERLRLANIIKSMPMMVAGLMESRKAIYAVGGADLNQINMKTMQSKIIPGLFIVGDLLNIDRPSGGYSLQLCWTTGYVAGSMI